MDDSKIIDLFYERSEKAIIELSKKYEPLCKKIANNILNNSLDRCTRTISTRVYVKGKVVFGDAETRTVMFGTYNEYAEEDIPA